MIDPSVPSATLAVGAVRGDSHDQITAVREYRHRRRLVVVDTPGGPARAWIADVTIHPPTVGVRADQTLIVEDQ